MSLYLRRYRNMVSSVLLGFKAFGWMGRWCDSTCMARKFEHVDTKTGFIPIPEKLCSSLGSPIYMFKTMKTNGCSRAHCIREWSTRETGSQNMRIWRLRPRIIILKFQLVGTSFCFFCVPVATVSLFALETASLMLVTFYREQIILRIEV